MVNVNCGACGHLNTKGDCNLTACIFPCNFGTGGYVNKPQTNADLIRSMTDEELAKQIVEWNQGDCPTIGDCPETQNSFDECEP